MRTATDTSGKVTMYTDGKSGYVVLCRDREVYSQHAGLFVQSTMARLNVNVLPMLPAESRTSELARIYRALQLLREAYAGEEDQPMTWDEQRNGLRTDRAS